MIKSSFPLCFGNMSFDNHYQQIYVNDKDLHSFNFPRKGIVLSGLSAINLNIYYFANHVQLYIIVNYLTITRYYKINVYV